MNSNIQDIISGRRSVRRYEDRPVPRAVLEDVLTAAIWAPSAHNRQPWRFAVISSPDVRQRLATAMGVRLRADLQRDNLPTDVIEKDATRSYSRITKSPVVVMACLSMADMDRYPDARRSGFEKIMAIQSTSLAVQNLLLAAHANGLGACWMCAPLFCPDVVLETLNLPADWEPQALVTMGYPAEVKHSTRQPLETRVLWC